MFGIRKQLQAEYGMKEKEKHLQEIKKNKIILENKEIELKKKLDATEKRIKEKRKVDEERKKAQLDFLTGQEDHLGKFLGTLQDPSAKYS